jgi:SNF2 family DNA or RNA helicase
LVDVFDPRGGTAKDGRDGLDEVKELIRPLMLRRDKDKVLGTELPPMREVVLYTRKLCFSLRFIAIGYRGL